MNEHEFENAVRKIVEEYDSLNLEEKKLAGPLSVESLWKKAFQCLIDDPYNPDTNTTLHSSNNLGIEGPSMFRSLEAEADNDSFRKLPSRIEAIDSRRDSSTNIMMRNVPSLYRFALLEGRIHSKIYSALATRPVVTVYELEKEICLMERVPCFSELRLGTSLLDWPVIQIYFQTRPGQVVFPVTSQMFLQFIAHHPSAEQVRDGVGDVRDAMHAFRFYYEKEVLPNISTAQGNGWGSNTFETATLPSRVNNTRAMGIYVQHFPEIIASLRQESAIHDKKASLAAILNNPTEKIQKKANIPFYQKVLSSLDHALSTKMPSSGALSFSVHCSDQEFSSFIFPQAWKRIFEKESLPEGGYRIEFTIGSAKCSSCSALSPSPCTTSQKKKYSSQNTEEILSLRSSIHGDQEGSSLESSSVSGPTYPNTRKRRLKRGKITSDQSDTLNEHIFQSWEKTIAPPLLTSMKSFPHFGFSNVSIPVQETNLSNRISQEVDAEESITHAVLDVPDAQEEGNRKGGSTNAPCESPMEMLKKELDEKEINKINVIHCLQQLQPGSKVNVSLLILAFQSLSHLSIVPEERKKLWDTAFIPLISTRSSYEKDVENIHTIKDADSSMSVCFEEIDEMASPSTVCWSFHFSPANTTVFFLDEGEEELGLPGRKMVGQALENSEVRELQSIQKYFRRHLSKYYPPYLRSFFVHQLGVFPYPTISTWFSTWRVMSREAPLCENVEKDYLTLFSLCVQEELLQRTDQYLSCNSMATTVTERNQKNCQSSLHVAAENALFDLTNSLSDEMCIQSFLFPKNKRWWRGADGLVACGPRYFGCRGLYFQPDHRAALSPNMGGDRNDLLCLNFKDEIHFAVEAVLQCCGVHLIHQDSIPFIFMEHPRGRAGHNDASRVAASIHTVMEAILSCVQFYLRNWYPILYALSEKEIRRRLGSVRVLLGYNVHIIEQLEDPLSGQTFTMKQAPRVRYLPSHNAFYGPVEVFSSPVLAEVLCDFFLPLEPSAATRQEFCAFLRHILSKTSDASGERVDDNILSHLMEEEKRRLGQLLDIKKTSCSIEMELSRRTLEVNEGGEEKDLDIPWEIVRPPSRVLRSAFPPGEGVLGSGTVSLTLLRESKIKPSGNRDKWTEAQWRKDNPLRETIRTANKATAYGAVPPLWDGDGITSFSNPHTVLDSHFFSPSGNSTREGQDSRELPTRNNTSSSTARSSAVSVGLKRYRGDPKVTMEKDFFSVGQVKAVTVGEEESHIRRYALEGEKFVWKRLQDRFSSDSSIHVVWLNEQAEKGEPYDIVVCRDDKNGHRRILYFVEVKSTSSGNRRDFELSLSEFLFAARYGSAFHVHRVYNASTHALRRMRVEEYSNLISQWQGGQLTLTGDIHVVPPLICGS